MVDSVKEAREKIAATVALPEGYHIEWGGQFENMERANRKLRTPDLGRVLGEFKMIPI